MSNLTGTGKGNRTGLNKQAYNIHMNKRRYEVPQIQPHINVLENNTLT